MLVAPESRPRRTQPQLHTLRDMLRTPMSPLAHDVTIAPTTSMDADVEECDASALDKLSAVHEDNTNDVETPSCVYSQLIQLGVRVGTSSTAVGMEAAVKYFAGMDTSGN